MKYTEYKLGDKITYIVDEWPFLYGEYSGKVAAVYDDHILIDVPGISDHIWIDEDNEEAIKMRSD